MDIKVKRHQTITIVQLTGELTVWSAKELRETFQDMMDHEAENFIFDLTDLDYIDSSGIGALVHIKKALEHSEPKKRLKIVNCNDRIKKIIGLARLTDFFPLSENLEETVNQMNSEIQSLPDRGK